MKKMEKEKNENHEKKKNDKHNDAWNDKKMMNAMITKMIKNEKTILWPGPVCGCKFFIRIGVCRLYWKDIDKAPRGFGLMLRDARKLNQVCIPLLKIIKQ